MPFEHRAHDRRAVERLPDAQARAVSLCVMSAQRLLAAVTFRPDPGVDTPGPEREPRVADDVGSAPGIETLPRGRVRVGGRDGP